MKFREYPDRNTYVIVHYTGNGVVEDPYTNEVDIQSFEDGEEALEKVKELHLAANTKEQLESSWLSNRYGIIINTITDKGKELYTAWSKEFDKRMALVNEDMVKNPDNYTTVEDSEDRTIILKKNPIFDK